MTDFKRLQDVPRSTLRKVYDWPDLDSAFDDQPTIQRHIINFCLMRRDTRKMVKVWEVMPDNPTKYILVGTLLPRPGFEEEGSIEVEIETILSYSIDFGLEEEDPDKMFS